MSQINRHTIRGALCAGFFISASVMFSSCTTAVDRDRLLSARISNISVNDVDRDLFSEILPRAGSGNISLESLADGKTGEIQEAVLGQLKQMQIPTTMLSMRVHSQDIDWRDTVNHMPGRSRFRSSLARLPDGSQTGTRFGVDEFFRLMDRTGSKAAFRFSLLEGLSRKKTIKDCALSAASLAAYCNAERTDSVPSHLSAWPAARMKNGRPLPVGLKYLYLAIQEASLEAADTIRASVPHLDSSQLTQWYIDAVSSAIRFIRDADPGISIILDADLVLDGESGQGIAADLLKDGYIRDNVGFLAFNDAAYPGKESGSSGHDIICADTDLTWYELTSRLGQYDEAGFCIGPEKAAARARALGKPGVITTWQSHAEPVDMSDHQTADNATALGLAAWYHGLARQGQWIKIAFHAGLIADLSRTAAADDTAVHGAASPSSQANAEVAMLYRLYTGTKRVQSEFVQQVPALRPGLTQGNPDNRGRRVAAVDLIATKTDSCLTIHILNRDPLKAFRVKLILDSFDLQRTFRTCLLELKGTASPSIRPVFYPEQPFKGNVIVHEAPAASVSMVILPLQNR